MTSIWGAISRIRWFRVLSANLSSVIISVIIEFYRQIVFFPGYMHAIFFPQLLNIEPSTVGTNDEVIYFTIKNHHQNEVERHTTN